MDRRPSDKRLSFNEVPEVYDEIRPGYPAQLYEALFETLPPHPTVLEVGPGTGQATRDLLDRGARIHAIEIGPAMAAMLRSNLPTDRLEVTIGDFEEVQIAPSSFDAVFAATAYHWISPRAQTTLPARLLRPAGTIAIVDLVQVTSRGQRVLPRSRADLRQVRRGAPRPASADAGGGRSGDTRGPRTRSPLL